MRLSKLLLPTLKEIPREAEISSHVLMLRAGLIRKLASGLYVFLPLGVRVLKKIIKIISDEMDRADAQECRLSILTPASLWRESGRWDIMGPEMFRLEDRHNTEYALGPTHEEVFTDIVRKEVHSYKQLPLNLYQIHTKFRDEVRPRYGVMRSREFTMKDAYSFDISEEGLDISYNKMREAYKRIFKRCGLETISVSADTGAMGGTGSEEFMVESEVGEEILVICKSCDYSANIEKAKAKIREFKYKDVKDAIIQEIDTPNVRTIDELTEFLDIEPEYFIKTLIYRSEKGIIVALIRGDLDINETKLKNVSGVNELFLADEKDIIEITGAPIGFAGPVGLNYKRIIADFSVRDIRAGITGANKKDKHIINVYPERDFRPEKYADISRVKDGDICAICGKPLIFKKGIEVGHIFKLGKKYTKAFNAVYLDKFGRESIPFMGCYGIGVERTMAAVIEQNHDNDGIVWPIAIAPYLVHLINIDKNETEYSSKIYDELIMNGIEVLYDERKISPGIKFKDADLIGIPLILIIGKHAKKNNQIEYKIRSSGYKGMIDRNDLISQINELLR